MLELDEDIALKSSIDETLHDGTSFFFILKSYSVTRDDDDENCIFNTKHQDQDVINQSSTTTICSPLVTKQSSNTLCINKESVYTQYKSTQQLNHLPCLETYM